MIELLHVNQSESGAGLEILPDKPATCELCSDSDIKTMATAFCVECDQCICDRCSVIHKKTKATRSHQVVPVEEIECLEDRRKLTVSYCDQHEDKQVELYCYDCKAATCVSCYVEKHNKHECADIRNSIDLIKKELTTDIDSVSVCASQSLKKIEGIVENVEVARIKVSKLTTELNASAQVLKNLETEKDEVERQYVIMTSFIRYCQEMRDKGTTFDTFRSIRDLHARAVELVKTQAEIDSRQTVSGVDELCDSSITERDCTSRIIDESILEGILYMMFFYINNDHFYLFYNLYFFTLILQATGA